MFVLLFLPVGAPALPVGVLVLLCEPSDRHEIFLLLLFLLLSITGSVQGPTKVTMIEFDFYRSPDIFPVLFLGTQLNSDPGH